MKNTILKSIIFGSMAVLLSSCSASAQKSDIIHDAEYYVLLDQNKAEWLEEDKDVQGRLAELREKHGKPPNIVHIMWDDMSVGEVGIPAINKIRGYDTPHVNRMAKEGILFTRMYTEASCTPSRAAMMTGRHAFRSGMTDVGFPIEARGLSGKEFTIAEVLGKAGYKTAFYGKWHLGDVEESYPYNQGFDEAFFTPYNQVLSLYNDFGERANILQGLKEDLLAPNPYKLDGQSIPKGWVMTIEGKKGEKGKEWGGTDLQDYMKIDPTAQAKTIEFIKRSNDSGNPFYIAYWPNMVGFIPPPTKKQSRNRSLVAEGFQNNVDVFLGKLMDELTALGIAENTLVIAMADNGPMVHDPPPGVGMNETIFRGGKDDYWEGGIRVPAFAWWPGVIEPDQIVGDMIHQTDLYTTFATLAGARKHIPKDRVVDGIDQSSLILNGDTYGRRDYNFVYQGNRLAATIKDDVKRVWEENEASITPPMYNILMDTREKNPVLVPLLHYGATFRRMRDRHDKMIKKYPVQQPATGAPFTGLENTRPETEALWEQDWE